MGRVTSLPIDNMPAAELAIHLMTSGFSLSGGEPEARRLLAKLRTQWLAAEADEIVAYCPDHSDNENTWLACHCPVADEMRRRADASRRTS